MAWMLSPEQYREGVWQMRPALFGWQYRTRPYGLTWGNWGFRFGRQASVRASIQEALGARFTEVPLDDGT
jgi:hypothetical protein